MGSDRSSSLYNASCGQKHFTVIPMDFRNHICSLIVHFPIRDENEVVQSVVESLLQVPETAHGAVRFTTLLLLGELGEWMDKHPAVVGMHFSCMYIITYIQLIIKICRTCASLRAAIHQ